MLAQQRQAAILELIRQRGGVRVSQLVSRFAVSDMTIRRDLEVLAERGLVDKVHGGATLAGSGPGDEPGFATKSLRQRAEKRAIAEHAAALVEPGMAVALSAGTTTAVLAALLTEVRGLTVVTNSIPVAEALHQNPRADQTVVLTGGIRTPSDALTGPVAEAAISSLNVDVLFLGVHGMSPRTGFTTPNLLEAGTDRCLVEASRRLVVLADHTKWGTIGTATIAQLSEADMLVTDAGLPPEARGQLREQVGELIVVRTGVDPRRARNG
ncbi:DeoR/GlpR family DNA-binding transcription regulator [Micromonospora sp. RTGN7]|uniref:DeoR/GlpR family DNA-binding transcription regulator n=1 Tax=Micromonospora sp. RTGN7 TaxID=3016526 RepID=UPI0029FF13A9|nr:DeoR/GlpR family DNA-binding transcription regulator [Micromonospora sp. RTGN7]